MPAIGFGTWSLYGSEAVDAIKSAIQSGYRLIDTAKVYGNEKEVGQAIASSLEPRSEVFVTTKLWTGNQGYDSALKALDESLGRLALEYVDLYLIHSPKPSASLRSDSWRAFQELRAAGKAKAIGVSNYTAGHLRELLGQSPEVPAVNQILFNPFVYKEQKPIIDFCKQHNILVEAYSPLARGDDLNSEVISAIAKKLAKTNAQVLLRWAIQHGTVPIPKSGNPNRIRENISVFDFELLAEDMRSLDSLSR